MEEAQSSNLPCCRPH